MDYGDDSGSEAGDGESDDVLDNSLERPSADADDNIDDEDEDEHANDDMMEKLIRRPLIPNDSEIMENLFARHHFPGCHGHFVDSFEGKPHVGRGGDFVENYNGGIRMSEDEDDAIGCSRGRVLYDEEQEPYQGMQFESEEAAKCFYNSYARRVGFSVRVSIYCRSKRDGSIISRKFVCSKEGFRRKRNAGGGSGEIKSKRPRAISREGCKAMILVKKESSGVWVVSKLQKEHNHPLASPGQVHCLRSHRGDKDKTIRELTCEIERVNQKCANYRSHLLLVLKDLEEHLVEKVQDVRQFIRDIESEERDH